PVFPASVIVVVSPAQIGVAVAVAVPPTLVGFTTTVATVEVAGAHVPLVTIAWNSVVTVNTPVFKLALIAPAISANGFTPVRDCHWIVPVFPASVIVVVSPAQIGVAVAVAVPPTLVGFTTTVATVEVAGAHVPLVTI